MQDKLCERSRFVARAVRVELAPKIVHSFLADQITSVRDGTEIAPESLDTSHGALAPDKSTLSPQPLTFVVASECESQWRYKIAALNPKCASAHLREGKTTCLCRPPQTYTARTPCCRPRPLSLAVQLRLHCGRNRCAPSTSCAQTLLFWKFGCSVPRGAACGPCAHAGLAAPNARKKGIAVQQCTAVNFRDFRSHQ